MRGFYFWAIINGLVSHVILIFNPIENPKSPIEHPKPLLDVAYRKPRMRPVLKPFEMRGFKKQNSICGNKALLL